MTNKSRLRFATVGAVAFAVSLSSFPLALADPTPTPQVPQRATATPQVPQVVNRQATPVPQPVQQAVPGIQRAAQPLVPQQQIVYIESEPVIITQTIVETEYVDRQVVEEAGGLLILDPDVQATVGLADVYNAASLNYASRTGADRVTLDHASGAAATGAVIGGTVGALGGALVAGTGTAVTGAVIGGAAGTAAQIPAQISCGITNIVAPGLGVPCAVIAATAGPAAGAAVGATVGAGVGVGAGAVAGGAAGATAGAAIGASFVPGGVEAFQGVAADSVWDLENNARVENGYKELVGDKPSGAPGNVAPEESTDTRVTDGTVTGEGVNVAPASPVEPAVAIPSAPALPEPVADFNNAVQQAQANVDSAIADAQTNFNTVVNNQGHIPSIW